MRRGKDSENDGPGGCKKRRRRGLWLLLSVIQHSAYRYASVTAHYFVGNNGYYLIVASSAAGGAAGGVLYILKDLEKVIHIAVLVYLVENIKIADLIALADDKVFV